MQNPTDKIQVTLDLSFIRVSMDLWRQTTDMKLPVHDNFKVHFMQNRGPILRNFAKTATAWSSMLRAMAPTTPEDAQALDVARTEVEEFGGWATSEIAKLEHLAVEESISASMDEALLNPEIQAWFKNMGPKPPPSKA